MIGRFRDGFIGLDLDFGDGQCIWVFLLGFIWYFLRRGILLARVWGCRQDAYKVCGVIGVSFVLLRYHQSLLLSIIPI